MRIVTVLLGVSLTASTLSAQNRAAPSGVIYGPNVAFFVTSPPGWTLDNKSGAKDGAIAVFYRHGETWETGDAVIYANILSLADKSPEGLAKTVQADVERWRSGAPDAVIHSGLPLRTKDGKPVSVEVMESAHLPSYEEIAYVSDRGAVPILVLTAHTRAGFERALPDFERLVHSYESTRLTIKPE